LENENSPILTITGTPKDAGDYSIDQQMQSISSKLTPITNGWE
jgi:hypothetical protein